MPAAPPKRRLPQTTPGAAGVKPPPASNGTTAAPATGKPPAGPSGGQAQEGAERSDPTNPNAPSQAEADAGGPGNNTTSPNEDEQPGAAAPPPKPVDTDPLRFIIKDEPGQEAHDAMANGTEALHALMLGVQGLHTSVPPEMYEQVGAAANHLADAYRQANFGQHEGAVTAIGHAAGALERAGQVPSADKPTQDQVSAAYDAAVHVGNGIRDMNQSRPPWNPLPVKHKGLPLVSPSGEVKRAPFPVGIGRSRTASPVPASRASDDRTSGACKTCGTDIHRGGFTGQWVDRNGSAGADHTHTPDERQRDERGRFT